MENLINLDELSRMATAYAPKVLGALLTLILGFFIVGRIVNLLKKTMEKRNFDATLRPFILSLVSVLLKTLILISVAQMFGVATTSFVAIVGSAVFAIGLALQGTLGHFASGILILIFRPYKVGDYIVTQGHEGTVKEIQIFNTILKTLDNRDIIIPNGAITSGPIENLTSPGERKVDLTFGISYTDDIDKARSVLNQVIDKNEKIMQDKGVDIFVAELGDSSVNFKVRAWVKVEDYWDVYFYLHEFVKKEFDNNGVNIPFPQMDVHVKQ